MLASNGTSLILAALLIKTIQRALFIVFMLENQRVQVWVGLQGYDSRVEPSVSRSFV
jgi:hypothetical protein